jgi:hypothetical protein
MINVLGSRPKFRFGVLCTMPDSGVGHALMFRPVRLASIDTFRFDAILISALVRLKIFHKMFSDA